MVNTDSNNLNIEAPIQAWSFGHVLTTLWNESNIQDKQQLLPVSNCSQEAAIMANGLGKTVEGLGCLIADDENVGSFKDRCDVANMLFGISRQLDLISGMMFIGMSAENRLNQIARK